MPYSYSLHRKILILTFYLRRRIMKTSLVYKILDGEHFCEQTFHMPQAVYETERKKDMKKLVASVLALAFITSASAGQVSASWTKEQNSGWSYLQSNGQKATGWLQSQGNWYYLDSDGIMQTGWVCAGGKWYFMDQSGAMKTGWVKTDGQWYYLDRFGAMQTGFIHDGTDWYFMGASGALQQGATAAENCEAFTSTGKSIRLKDGIIYVDGVLIANKRYPLPQNYAPGGITSEVKSAFNTMKQAMAAQGMSLYISSGYRSYQYQAGLYQKYVSRDGKNAADRYSARAGYSEHQTGLAFDVNQINDSFANTAEAKWLAAHAHEYGFIIRYPKGKEDVTGYQYEPWHLRYLGKETAKAVYDSGLCLEEYLGIPSYYLQ